LNGTKQKLIEAMNSAYNLVFEDSEDDWRSAPGQAFNIYETMQKVAEETRHAFQGLPLELIKAVWHAPGTDEWHLQLAKHAIAHDMLGAGLPRGSWTCHWYSPTVSTGPNGKLAWVPVLQGHALPDVQKMAQAYEILDDEAAHACVMAVKYASAPDYSPNLRTMGELSGYLPGGQYSWQIPGVPRHLAGMLGGGLLGAGMGAGAGWLASRVLPRAWDRSRLPKTMAILGSLVGSAPGMAATLSNLANHSSWTDDGLFADALPPMQKYQSESPSYPGGSSAPAVFHHNPEYDPAAQIESPPSKYKLASDELDRVLTDELHPIAKKAISDTGYEIDYPMADIPVAQVARDMFDDPHVTSTLPLPMRAATYGLVDAAWRAKQLGNQDVNSVRVVSPADIARVTAGMGAGYLSGALVGRVLGTLLGAPIETQDTLKRVGLYSGAIANVLPLAFPGY
jgi:hypothetical protein